MAPVEHVVAVGYVEYYLLVVEAARHLHVAFVACQCVEVGIYGVHAAMLYVEEAVEEIGIACQHEVCDLVGMFAPQLQCLGVAAVEVGVAQSGVIFMDGIEGVARCASPGGTPVVGAVEQQLAGKYLLEVVVYTLSPLMEYVAYLAHLVYDVVDAFEETGVSCLGIHERGARHVMRQVAGTGAFRLVGAGISSFFREIHPFAQPVEHPVHIHIEQVSL